MKLLSINIGTQQTVQWKSKTYNTAFFKNPVTNSCNLLQLTIKGDEQVDKKYHGGITKAVYSYDEAYYNHWKKILPRNDWQFGMFGENLTTQGLIEHEVQVGNIYAIGTAQIQAIEPRFPCSKLNMRFQNSSMVKLFTKQGFNGIYFKVIQPGIITPNDDIVLIQKASTNITIANIVECHNTKGKNKQLLHQILQIPILPNSLIKNLQQFI